MIVLWAAVAIGAITLTIALLAHRFDRFLRNQLEHPRHDEQTARRQTRPHADITVIRKGEP